MPITERTPQRVVVQSGSTVLTLDKGAGTANLQRKVFFWKAKPMEVPLSEVANFDVDAGVDRASGIEVCNTMLITSGGAAWAVPASDKKDAEATAAALREWLKA
jgi:hypothetical protein